MSQFKNYILHLILKTPILESLELGITLRNWKEAIWDIFFKFKKSDLPWKPQEL